MTKLYILDTNVLIHDPEAIFKFEENVVGIPMVVIEELDKLKTLKAPVAKDAREASRNLKKAIETPVGTTRIAILDSSQFESPINDNLILACAAYYWDFEEGQLDHPVDHNVLITKDTNMWLKAKGLGIRVEDYRNDILRGEMPVNAKVFPSVAALMEVEIDERPKWYVENNDIFKGNDFHPYPDKTKIKPRNQEQLLAKALLEDMNTDFVVLEGPAGSGKTFLSLAYALDAVMDRKEYQSIVILRSQDPDAIGFLPGTEEEKMLPWLQGFMDNLEVLVGNDTTTLKHTIEKARIKFRSLEMIRGRSYQDTLIIADEVQNNTPHQLKALATRVGEGSKLICLGNLAQIDTPYLNERTSGLKHLATKMVGYEGAGIMQFKDVHRSPLTKFAEENL